MQVLLLIDLKGVGRRGEVKAVSDGYARNFLIPRKLAEPVSDVRVSQIALAQKKAEDEKSYSAKNLQKIAQELAGMPLKFTRKADKSGTVFGSVTAADIAQSLSENLGLPISPDALALKHPLKKVGQYVVSLNLGYGIMASVKVIIAAS